MSPQDNAYEVMGLVSEGHRLFEVISRYDYLVTLEKREGYEPGDTLALIAPFLVHHNITEADIRDVSERAYLVDGTRELISKLEDEGWQVRRPHRSVGYRKARCFFDLVSTHADCAQLRQDKFAMRYHIGKPGGFDAGD